MKILPSGTFVQLAMYVSLCLSLCLCLKYLSFTVVTPVEKADVFAQVLPMPEKAAVLTQVLPIPEKAAVFA
jgi:hypothetical protein